MARRGKAGGLRRSLIEFALALTVFWVFAFGANWGGSRAFAVTLPVLSLQAPGPVERMATPASLQAVVTGGFDVRKPRISQRHALMLFSIALAAIMAANLAFWRHLRRAYASPRRTVWRRGR